MDHNFKSVSPLLLTKFETNTLTSCKMVDAVFLRHGRVQQE